MVVSTQDRVMMGLGFAVVPLALAGVFAFMGKSAASATFVGLGIAAGAVGAVGAEWFVPRSGSSPLAQRGWVKGYPTADAVLLEDVNKKLVEAGGYAYSEEAFK